MGVATSGPGAASGVALGSSEGTGTPWPAHKARLWNESRQNRAVFKNQVSSEPQPAAHAGPSCTQHSVRTSLFHTQGPQGRPSTVPTRAGTCGPQTAKPQRQRWLFPDPTSPRQALLESCRPLTLPWASASCPSICGLEGPRPADGPCPPSANPRPLTSTPCWCSARCAGLQEGGTSIMGRSATRALRALHGGAVVALACL